MDAAALPSTVSPQQSLLQGELDALLGAERLRMPSKPTPSEIRDRAQALLQAWDDGELSALGPYGAQLVASLHATPRLKASLASLQVEAFPLFDGTGKVGRYLDMIQRALQLDQVRIPSNVLFAEYPTHRFNACVVPTRHGDLCLMNTGLLKLLYHVSVAANHAFEPDGRLGDIDSPAVQRAATLVLSVVAAYLGSGEHVHAQVATHPLPAEALYDATALAYAMRVFVLAHEVGHITLGHTCVDDLPARAQALAEAPVIGRTRDDEFAADRFAQNTLLRIDQAQLFAEPVACGGLGFLLVHATLLEIVAKMSGRSVDRLSQSESHPPTWDRIKCLDTYLSETYGDTSRDALARCVVLQRVLLQLERSRIVATPQGLRLGEAHPTSPATQPERQQPGDS